MYQCPMVKKVDQTRLNVPMPLELRDAIESHWRTLAGVTSAADYMRQLAEKDIADAKAPKK